MYLSHTLGDFGWKVFGLSKLGSRDIPKGTRNAAKFVGYSKLKKSYVDTRRWDLELQWVIRYFSKYHRPGTGKFIPRYIGPFEIIAQVGSLAYR